MNKSIALGAVYDYLATRRQVGHTTTMLEGAANTECIIIVANHDQRVKMQQKLDNPNTVVVTIEELSGCFVARKLPLAIDNFAMLHIAHEAIKRIEELEAQVSRMKRIAQQLLDA